MEVYANDVFDFNVDDKRFNDLLIEDKRRCEQEDREVMWYHGKVSRCDAEHTLEEASTRCQHIDTDGIFMVRDSSFSDVDFSLSFIHEKKCYHFYIQRTKEGYYVIDGGPMIHGLEKLIEYYTEFAVKLPTCLKRLCKGQVPPATTRRDGPTNILHRAVMTKQEEAVKRILNHPLCPDIDAKNSKGSTALHEAAAEGLDKTVSILLLKGADVRIKDQDGHTPLHKACLTNKSLVCQQLISHDLSSLLEKNPVSGSVPLHVAAMHGHLDCVKVLLKSKAAIFPRSLKDETPVELAEKYRRNSCIQILENMIEDDVSDADEEFFHPNLDRQGAEKCIKEHDMNDGLFLIRKSQSVENQNVLSLCHNKGVLNYEIKSKMYRGVRVHSIDMGPYHPSLRQLVQYYLLFDEGTPVKLQVYISRANKKVDLRKMAKYNQTPILKPPPLLAKPSVKALRLAPKPELPARPPDLESPPARLSPPTMSALKIEIGPEQEVLEIPASDIKQGTLLGEGEYGSVLKGVLLGKRKLLRRTKSMDVALKTFHSVGSMEDFRREAQVMQSLQHEHIVQLLGVCHGPPLMLVEEFVPEGSMLDFLENYPGKVRVKQELYLWAAQIARGMMYIETKSLVHRDLAARNILLKSLHHIKISDFGLSRAMGQDKDYYKATQGGRWPIKWYAPESVNFGHFSHASDVWSYGVTLWEMFTYGDAPFERMSGVEVIKYIEEGHRLVQPERCTAAVYQIMMQCWSFQPQDRPTFRQLNRMFDEDPEYMSAKEIINSKS